mgnify:CR=1 FL=1
MTIKIRLLAHASIQIETDENNIYIDPSTNNTGLKKDDFKPADLILVTHEHKDHFDKGLIKKIRKMGSPVLAVKKLCKKMGKGIVCWDLNPGEHMQISNGVHVWAAAAYNVKRFRKPGVPFHPKGEGVGFLIKVEEKKIYHAGDTDLIPEMEKLEEVGIDVALLPSGDTYTMDMNEAADAASIIHPKIAIPMHMKGADPSKFKEKVEAAGIEAIILKEGEEFTLN